MRSSVAHKSAMPARLQEKPKELEALMLLPPMESAADDINLMNPLQRSERLSTAWFGAIVEFEGVLVSSSEQEHLQAWLTVASEFGFSRPLGHLFRRIKGIKDEVVVARVFNWTQNPATARQISQRKRVIYEELLDGRRPSAMLEAKPFLDMLHRYNIPIALACALPEVHVRESLNRTGLGSNLNAVVTGEDSGAPEVEFYFSYAAQQIQRPPIRCVVFCESNQSVEAAHELGMKCVVVTGNRPVYDFAGADLVVRNLSDVNFINLKRLFSEEDLVKPKSEQEEELADDEVDDPELDDFEPAPGQRKGAFWS
eukprot:CAMPEP_0119105970 /NCGR_PEP_ID=MMETSP1180-20130426/3791_1 /TAXON_ID=3052 ORGANISM="Chlamydomonas cf sp, Strain CCMP681" /NCGR_SAMPLE_ID=MMETSP1180 /ASSEMBLY_ACC=CAM_ASM_000741 /LENGTH=311 /DNA_ID=CAMNT_0007091173 /DNA_START=124 /DNA_END=1059 /DNA_ORIENTATION=+